MLYIDVCACLLSPHEEKREQLHCTVAINRVMVCVATADSIVPLLFHLHVKENGLLNCFVSETRMCMSIH